MNQKCRILFVSASDPEEGAPHHTMAAIWLASRGWGVKLLTAGPKTRESLITPLGVVTATGIQKSDGWLGKIAWHLKLLRQIAKERLKGEFDLYFVEGSPVTPVALAALLFLPSSRIIYQTQDYLEPSRYWLRALIEKKFARRAGLVICNEPARARFMASHYSLPVVPMVVRTALPAAWPMPSCTATDRAKLLAGLSLDNNPSCKLILHQGAYNDVRCSATLLQAIALLPPEYKVLFTGTKPDSPPHQLALNMARSLGLKNRVFFLDRKPFTELLEITACCDIGILLYPDDGVGNYFQAPGRLTEYVGCGIPVVASNFPGLELTVLKFDLGAIADPRDAISISKAIQALGERLSQEREGGRFRLRMVAKNELAYDVMAEQIEKYLQSLDPA